MHPTACSPEAYTDLSGVDLRNTLARRLIRVADSVRDLYTRFGGRPYEVRIIRTRWSGGRRNIGEEILTSNTVILPTPLVSDLTSLTEIVQPVGLDEIGGIQVSQISGRYTEEQLLGRYPDGSPPEPDEQVFWEIEFPLTGACAGDDAGSPKRRFIPRSAPYYSAFGFQWTVGLERSHEDRARNGDLR